MNDIMTKKSIGQYFTTSVFLQELVHSLVKNKRDAILEPSVGAGHLLSPFLRENPTRRIVAYDIDTTIQMLHDVALHNEDFLSANLTEKFGVIVANPPFVRVAKGSNLYLSFIEKCYNSLSANGEMVFIVPSSFGRSTSSCKLILRMVSDGCFTHLIYPNDEHLFDDAAVDVMVFRYERSSPSSRVLVGDVFRHLDLSQGFLLPIALGKTTKIGDLFDVFVGIVSGCDKVFKHPCGNVKVINSNGAESYILTDHFPTESATINAHLLAHRATLEKRKICKITDANWFKWGALRNIERVRCLKGRACIYVRCLTRSPEVAFGGSVDLFGGSLLCLVPKCGDDMIAEALSVLNSAEFKKEHTLAGRFTITHKMICNVFIR